MYVFVDRYIVWCVVVISQVICNPVMNNFNTSVRDYAVPEDNINSTGIRTLQKAEFARYANFAPVRTPIKFKDIPDSALSSSSHQGRGLLHEHNAYGIDYDDNQQHEHGLDYHLYDTHLQDHHQLGHGYGYHLGYGLHSLGLHDPHHNDHSHYHHDDHSHHHDGHGHHETHLYHGDHERDHHKHLAHALAAKTVLWPIAGIALLGAAAALVTNPVLLQLGVVSGRRKRETQETTHFDPDSLKEWLSKNPMVNARKIGKKSEKTIEDESGFKVIKPLDNSENRIVRKVNLNNGRKTVAENEGNLKRNQQNRLLNVNKRIVSRKSTSANHVYVSQSDLPRTETDHDKHYIAVPLLTKS